MRMMRTFGRAALGIAVATLMSVAPTRAADTVTIGTVGSPSANLWPLFIAHGLVDSVGITALYLGVAHG